MNPLWEAAGSYHDACWALDNISAMTPESALSGMALEDARSPTARRIVEGLAVQAQSLREAMRLAHIVTCSREQVEALPLVRDEDLLEYAKHLLPPFPVTYLALERAAIPGTDSTVLGALLISKEAAERSNTGAEYERDIGKDVWAAFPIEAKLGDTENEDRFPMFNRVVVKEDTYRLIDAVDLGYEAADLDKAKLAAWKAVERAIAVMLLLDNTVGVDLEPAKVSRQVRRNAQRKGAQIAWTVTIRSGTRRTVSRGGTVDYSHRFERRAHFACVTKGPHVKDPEKLSSWCPRHGAGACRREFKRATVVGPEDKPLIPKVRKVG